MNRRSVGTTLMMLLLLFAAGALAWRAIQSPGIVRAQQASATSATQQQTTPPAGPQQEAAPNTAPNAAPQAPADKQQSPTGTSIKAETREVRVDVVVTDKKGNYVEDLKTNDFRLYEDDKQQPINSLSRHTHPKPPTKSNLFFFFFFFNNIFIFLIFYPRARAAAAKFIDA